MFLLVFAIIMLHIVLCCTTSCMEKNTRNYNIIIDENLNELLLSTLIVLILTIGIIRV